MDGAANPFFTRPVVDPEAVAAARRVRDTYETMVESTGDYAGQDIDDPAEDIVNVPDYRAASAALGSMLAFMFPAYTYGNEDVDPDISFDRPVGDLCVSILDPRPGSDPDLYAHSIITAARWEVIGLEAMDECHFEFLDKTQSIAQAIQKLLDTGLDYQRESVDPGEPCLFRDRLAAAIPAETGAESDNSPARPRP